MKSAQIHNGSAQKNKKSEGKIIPKKTSILFIITKNNFGGAQKYVFDLATELQNNKSFSIKVATGADTKNMEPLLDIKLKDVNIEVLKIDSLSNSLNPIKLLKQIFEIRKTLQKENPDTIHINSNMAGLSSTIACSIYNIQNIFKKNKIQTIFTAHGWPFNENRNIFEKIILKFICNIIVLLADKTIAVSEKTKKDLWRLSQKKVIVIYNGLEKIIKQNPWPQFLMPLAKNKINLLSIGELHHVKGHDIVIDALAKIKNRDLPFHYHIIGEGNFRNDLEKKILKNNLQKNITLHGYIKDAKSYINNFDIFVMPSRSEAFAYALIEGYESELPIIHTQSGGMPEVRDVYLRHNKENTEKRSIMIECNVKSFVDIFSNQEILSALLKYKNNSKYLSHSSETPKILTKENMINETIKVYK